MWITCKYLPKVDENVFKLPGEFYAMVFDFFTANKFPDKKYLLLFCIINRIYINLFQVIFILFTQNILYC